MSDIMAMPPQPVNYTGLQIQADPIGAFQKAAALQNTQAQTGLLNAQAQDVQQSALLRSLAAQRQQNFQQQWQQFSQNPTPQGAVQMAMSNPEWAQQVQGAWNGFNEQQRQQKLDFIAPIVSSLQNGRGDLATNLVQQHIDAITNTPGYEKDPQMQQDLAGAKQMLSTIESNPKAALAQLYGTAAAAQGPQDFMFHFGQGAMMPSTIAAAQYAPAQALASVGLTNAQAQDLQSVIQNRAATFQLDQNKFLADLQLKLRDLNYTQTAPNMDENTRNIVTSGALDSVQHGQMADRVGTLLSNVATLNQNGQWVSGKPEDVRNFWQNIWGSQDNVSSLRNEYQSIMKGVSGYGQAGLSDADRKVLEQGLPAKNANPDQIVQFLGSMRNASLRAARISDGSSSWAGTFGWMGPAKYDANVGGVQIAKGTTFAQFMKSSLSANSGAPSAFAAPTAAPGVQIGPQTFTQPNGQPGGNMSGPLARYSKYLTGQ
ncbi:MAG: hypothetical protein EPN70_03545 [Paraburkholderia sp.]|uniref:hypothetical protein n=1 Tax=Paraburkholderia sp. TaxID=1926495 RepID=UPI001215429D|nr:hypothetical protein [Paraburkholderia sp.]TAM07259.1 MAG: hypothetical protein EPN70_03545 [Paraburkholderia sp.]TAM32602.1 MAG: hypothetical protein EPN59_01515 [Paraburkholderia sp.]